MTNNIGIVYPVSLSGNQSFYCSTNNDNNDFFISFPNNNVTISLNQFETANLLLGNEYANTMPHYVLILSLQRIE